MTVTVSLKISVNPADWAVIYGCGDSVKEVRADVRTYVLDNVAWLAGIVDSGATVTGEWEK